MSVPLRSFGRHPDQVALVQIGDGVQLASQANKHRVAVSNKPTERGRHGIHIRVPVVEDRILDTVLWACNKVRSQHLFGRSFFR